MAQNKQPLNMQRSPRRKLINRIAELTDTEDKSIRKKRLSAPQVHAVYREIIGKEPDLPKGRGWHVKKILEELDALEYKSYVNKVSISMDGLQTIIDHLEQS